MLKSKHYSMKRTEPTIMLTSTHSKYFHFSLTLSLSHAKMLCYYKTIGNYAKIILPFMKPFSGQHNMVKIPDVTSTKALSIRSVNCEVSSSFLVVATTISMKLWSKTSTIQKSYLLNFFRLTP